MQKMKIKKKKWKKKKIENPYNVKG